MTRKVGDLNGVWAILLRITLVAVPVVGSIITACGVPWIKWVSDSCHTANQTARIVEKLAIDIEQIRVDMAHMPPEDWRERIRQLEVESRQNRQDHLNIMVSLEQIKTKLGVSAPTPVANNSN